LAILFVIAWPTNAKDLTLPDRSTSGAIRHDFSKSEICIFCKVPFTKRKLQLWEFSSDHPENGSLFDEIAL
jgi:hypothetical protein